ncbi:hypothetical protein Clacol_008136 [Clathrus columnatus]|uniref:Alpha-1,4 glucan phosphorylase n=1 Tax=Clathrus columnatus TaxID=1419009 RepID=A0AAV5AL68_9AGAM|nr:hypothetical protein Clacol_008136 [Clathrus columnatus]
MSIDPQQIGKPSVKPKVRHHKRTPTGYLPELTKDGKEIWPKGDEATWKKGLKDVSTDNYGAYQATALSVRDELIVNWNDTQMHYTRKAPKRAYYLSALRPADPFLQLEFLMGRSLDNALLNLGLKDKYEDGTNKLGFNLEDLFDCERDAGLGNGGLGRLAACYLDSSATTELPLWGYGLRYKYGIFQQLIAPDGSQFEAPDPWLSAGYNPWEMPRPDVTYDVRFYGQAERTANGRAIWSGGQEVVAVAHDVPIPGHGTKTTNCIRLWDSKARRGFDLQSFNAGNYEGAVELSNSAEQITSVLYPNDNHSVGKELRLKQQYFWTAASLADILRRFKNIGRPMSELPDYVAIQLNDTHPTLAIVELQRILVDEEDLSWDEAWSIVTRTFFYTNHTVLPEALEKWPVPLMQHLLPRHMQIIFDLNLSFLQAVEKKFPGDVGKLQRVSLIEEGFPQNVRMANLAVIGMYLISSNDTCIYAFHREPQKPQCNPLLSDLITETLKIPKDKWLKDLTLLKGLVKYADDKAFHAKWAAVKRAGKERLAKYVESTMGVQVNPDHMFDVQCKRIHEYKRQTLNILGVIHAHTLQRYLALKKMAPEERKEVVPRVVFFAGKAAPGYYMAKLTIRLIVRVSQVINADSDTNEYLKLFFLPDYSVRSVSLAEIIIPASDISQHISTAGTEASGTSNMKRIVKGTVDGANIEIAEEIGEDQVFFFGHLAPAVEELRYQHMYRPLPVNEKSPDLAVVLDAISGGMFGEEGVFEPGPLFDYDLIANKTVDTAFADQDEWIKKSIMTVAKMGKFSADRAIMVYAEEYWNIEPVPIPTTKA